MRAAARDWRDASGREAGGIPTSMAVSGWNAPHEQTDPRADRLPAASRAVEAAAR